jgi:hypothetical protein
MWQVELVIKQTAEDEERRARREEEKNIKNVKNENCVINKSLIGSTYDN